MSKTTTTKPVLDQLRKAKRLRRPLLGVLADPDKVSSRQLSDWALRSHNSDVDMFLVGSSLLERNTTEECVQSLKEKSTLPVVLFPGNVFQVTPLADAILFLSLLSGRNAELLIGQQVAAAHLLKDSSLEVIGTGYLLIDGGNTTAAAYMSQTIPVPAEKHDIAAMTALAGTMLGMHAIYLDAGSGAQTPVPAQMIKKVRQTIDAPLIVGGGIRSRSQFQEAVKAGADMVVVGSIVEEGKWPINWKSSDGNNKS